MRCTAGVRRPLVVARALRATFPSSSSPLLLLLPLLARCPSCAPRRRSWSRSLGPVRTMNAAGGRRLGTVLLSCKWKDGSARLPALSETSTLGELKQAVSVATSFHRDRLLIKMGFPPTPVNASSDASLLTIGLKSGSTIVVEDTGPPPPPPPPPQPRDGPEAAAVPIESLREEPRARSVRDKDKARPARRHGRLVRIEVPKDDSCFFASVALCIRDRVGAPCTSATLRDDVAAVILSGQDTYDAAILGQAPEEYADWIRLPTAWGGAIEAAILAELYSIEIDVVSIETCTLQQFGQQANYDGRILLLYDGGHYDPLCRDLHDGTVAAWQNVFSRDDEAALHEALRIARDARTAGQYVTADLKRLRLRCSECGARCDGVSAANSHTGATGHGNFEQVEH